LSKDMNAYNEYKSTLNVIVTSLRHRKGWRIIFSFPQKK
jgi:hypothetical protein